jgi:hypothetical protein
MIVITRLALKREGGSVVVNIGIRRHRLII